MKRGTAGRRMRKFPLKHRSGGRRVVSKKDAPLSAKESRQLLQMVICASAFVLLVAAKLLLPERMAEFNLRLSGALEQNMDVQSVFNAVGRAFSGEEDVADAADEVYQAVFYPEESEVVRTSAPAALETDSLSALDTLQEYRSVPAGPEEKPVEPFQTTTLAYILYSDRNLPESVSLEQAILGFDYCSPLPGGTLSSNFGYRDHPTEGDARFHYGIDLAADTGTAVSCFADGRVKAVGESSSYGKYCIVDHEGGYSTLYAHCSRITASSGAEVSGGEKIAEVGETGMATGPHLHFELQRDGTYLNPIYYVSVL